MLRTGLWIAAVLIAWAPAVAAEEGEPGTAADECGDQPSHPTIAYFDPNTLTLYYAVPSGIRPMCQDAPGQVHWENCEYNPFDVDGDALPQCSRPDDGPEDP